jgi:chemotaxis protein CheD
LVQVLPGDLYVTRVDEVISTVLGSCVSACVRDVARGVGGINHFMLPDAPVRDGGSSARYGVYALACLIDGVLRAGGTRGQLEVKVFGGGRVLATASDIGLANIELVHRFFAGEGLRIVAEDVGGPVARRLRYWPISGRVQVQQMPIASAA